MTLVNYNLTQNNKIGPKIDNHIYKILNKIILVTNDWSPNISHPLCLSIMTLPLLTIALKSFHKVRYSLFPRFRLHHPKYALLASLIFIIQKQQLHLSHPLCGTDLLLTLIVEVERILLYYIYFYMMFPIRNRRASSTTIQLFARSSTVFLKKTSICSRHHILLHPSYSSMLQKQNHEIWRVIAKILEIRTQWKLCKIKSMQMSSYHKQFQLSTPPPMHLSIVSNSSCKHAYLESDKKKGKGRRWLFLLREP